MTKTQLRKRWKDPDFLKELNFPIDRIPNESEVQNLDLRGIPKLYNGEPLWHFQLHSVKSTGIDMSFGNGALNIFGSDVKNLNCTEFRFIKQSSFYKTTFTDCNFEKTKLSFDLIDSEFHNCNFNLSTFAGGFNEYGLQRCKFINCTFNGIRWERTFFKAVTFINCDFQQAQIVDCYTASFKYQSCINFSKDIFLEEENPNLIDLGQE